MPVARFLQSSPGGAGELGEVAVPAVRPTSVASIHASDLHLTLTPPPARAKEPDWLEAQKRPLDQIRRLAEEHQAPVFYSGDVFDRPQVSPELVNWTIKHLPKGYAIAGNHDLKWHNHEDLHKTSYQTLVEAGVLIDLVCGKPVAIGQARYWGFPWGFPVRPLKKRHGLALEVALVHAYVWVGESGHFKSPKDAHLDQWEKRLASYDAAFFGDNHSGFVSRCGSCRVANTGTMTRRRRDEGGYRPFAALLHEDGSIEKRYLDCSEDVFSAEGGSKKAAKVPSRFAKELGSLERTGEDFEAEVEAELRTSKAGKLVEQIVHKAMEAEK